MSDTPRYYKYFPQETIDLGTMPFEGDWTPSDRITQPTVDGITKIYLYGKDVDTEEYGFGTMYTRKVGNRMRQVFKVGVTIGPIYWEIDGQQVQAPVWFMYYGDGVCAVKLPNGEQPEPYEP